MIRTDLLAPGFLVASPRLDGSLFERSVIVMVNHDEQGAMGFIINKVLMEKVGVTREEIQQEATRLTSKKKVEET